MPDAGESSVVATSAQSMAVATSHEEKRYGNNQGWTEAADGAACPVNVDSVDDDGHRGSTLCASCKCELCG